MELSFRLGRRLDWLIDLAHAILSKTLQNRNKVQYERECTSVHQSNVGKVTDCVIGWHMFEFRFFYKSVFLRKQNIPPLLSFRVVT